MRQLIEELWDQVWQASSTAVFEAMRHRVQETIDENRAILAGLKQRSVTQVEVMMTRRMTNTIAAWQAAVALTPLNSAGGKAERAA